MLHKKRRYENSFARFIRGNRNGGAYFELGGESGLSSEPELLTCREGLEIFVKLLFCVFFWLEIWWGEGWGQLTLPGSSIPEQITRTMMASTYFTR